MQEHFPQSGRLPVHLKIKHGPVGLLGRYFLWADAAAKDLGVTLSFASLRDLHDLNRANSDTWRPLVPIFDQEIGGATSETAMVLFGRDQHGDVVATQAARVYDWTGTSLKNEAAALRMFYADPADALARGDRCTIAAPIAAEISGRVVFSGGVWYRRDYRGKDLGTILPRILRAYAFTRANSDFTIGIVANGVIAGGLPARAGYPHIEPDCIDLVASPLGEMRSGLAWMTADETIADLAATMQRVNAPAVTHRVAQDAV